MNNKNILAIFGLIIFLGLALFLYNSKNRNVQQEENVNSNVQQDETADIITSTSSPIVYKNSKYGFNFTLPSSWQGYSIVEESWTGTSLKGAADIRGPKLLIRNPKWTEAAPYEDLPILIFTIKQWNEYLTESFTVSAAPIQAKQLGRNDTYVFALPPRWDFDYLLGVEEAENIFSGNPLKVFNLGTVSDYHGS